MNYETSHNTSARAATGQFTCDTENPGRDIVVEVAPENLELLNRMQ